MIGGHRRVAYRIMITLRFRVRHWREIRRNQKGIHERIQKEGCFQKRGLVFNSLFLKILFFLIFSLDKNNIGCPLYYMWIKAPAVLMVVVIGSKRDEGS